MCVAPGVSVWGRERPAGGRRREGASERANQPASQPATRAALPPPDQRPAPLPSPPSRRPAAGRGLASPPPAAPDEAAAAAAASEDGGLLRPRAPDPRVSISFAAPLTAAGRRSLSRGWRVLTGGGTGRREE